MGSDESLPCFECNDCKKMQKQSQTSPDLFTSKLKLSVHRQHPQKNPTIQLNQGKDGNLSQPSISIANKNCPSSTSQLKRTDLSGSIISDYQKSNVLVECGVRLDTNPPKQLSFSDRDNPPESICATITMSHNQSQKTSNDKSVICRSSRDWGKVEQEKNIILRTAPVVRKTSN